jgi:hypothetical protein
MIADPRPPEDPPAVYAPQWHLVIRLRGGEPVRVEGLSQDRALDLASDLSQKADPLGLGDPYLPITTRRHGPAGRILTDYRLVRRAAVDAIEVIEQ